MCIRIQHLPSLRTSILALGLLLIAERMLQGLVVVAVAFVREVHCVLHSLLGFRRHHCLANFLTPRGRQLQPKLPKWPTMLSTARVAPQTPKKRAKSPAAMLHSPSRKRSRSRAPPVSQPKSNRDGPQRRSVGEYPVPSDEDMADVIPTWTQPVSPGGHWDDVHMSPLCLSERNFFFFPRWTSRLWWLAINHVLHSHVFVVRCCHHIYTCCFISYFTSQRVLYDPEVVGRKFHVFKLHRARLDPTCHHHGVDYVI